MASTSSIGGRKARARIGGYVGTAVTGAGGRCGRAGRPPASPAPPAQERPYTAKGGTVDAADVASVVFRVKVDDKLQFEKALSWRDPPVPLDVQVHDGRRLTLEVDFGGEVPGSMNSTLDRANWAEARLVQENTQ